MSVCCYDIFSRRILWCSLILIYFQLNEATTKPSMIRKQNDEKKEDTKSFKNRKQNKQKDKHNREERTLSKKLRAFILDLNVNY